MADIAYKIPDRYSCTPHLPNGQITGHFELDRENCFANGLVFATPITKPNSYVTDGSLDGTPGIYDYAGGLTGLYVNASTNDAQGIKLDNGVYYEQEADASDGDNLGFLFDHIPLHETVGDTDECTILCRFSWSGNTHTNWSYILGQKVAGGFAWGFGMDSAKKVFWRAGADITQYGSLTVVADTWYTVILSSGNGNRWYKVFNDLGENIADLAGGTPGNISDSGDQISFGHRKSDHRSFDGKVSHAYIWNRKMETEEIFALAKPLQCWSIFKQARPNLYLVPGATPTTPPVNQTSESDSALSMTHTKDKAITQPSDTETALGMGVKKSVTVQIATATDSSLTLVKSTKSKEIGISSETDTSLDMAPQGKVETVIETDSALALQGSQKSKAVLQPSDTETALSITARKTIEIGLTTDTETSLALDLADVFPPVFTVTPFATSIGSTFVTTRTTMTDSSVPVTFYAVILADGATAPTEAQIRAGTDSLDAPAPSGSVVMSTSGTSVDLTIGGLSASTAYDVYYTARDNSSNDTTVAFYNTTTTAASTGGGDVVVSDLVRDLVFSDLILDL